MALSITETAEFKQRVSEYTYRELFHSQDMVLVPIALLAIYFLLRYLRKNLTDELKPYLIPGYFFRLFGLGLFLVHHLLIYKGGVDSFTYYWSSCELNHLFHIDFATYKQLMLGAYDSFSERDFNIELSKFLFSKQEAPAIKITSVVGLITNNSFLVNSLLLGLYAYGGCWSIFTVFQERYPNYRKGLAITCLFIPSVIFWTSVISKEVFCFGAMGYFFYAFYRIQFNRKRSIGLFLLLFVNAYILYQIKVYILLSFLPVVFILLINFYTGKIKQPILRYGVTPIVLILVGYFLFLGYGSLGDALQGYSMDLLLENARITYVYLTQEGFAESRYTLGEFDPSVAGLLSLAPAGINVTLFRPYFWEANKVITLVASLESFLTLIFTLWVILKTGLLRTIRIIFSDSIVLSGLLFALFFALMVGITSGNFGTLMRYKIPMMPFYYSALWIIYMKGHARFQPGKEIASTDE